MGLMKILFGFQIEVVSHCYHDNINMISLFSLFSETFGSIFSGMGNSLA